MWATVRPLTSNTKLGNKVVSTIVVDRESCVGLYEYHRLLTHVGYFVADISNEIIPQKEIDCAANTVVDSWFRYMISYIISNATSYPMFVNDRGEDSIISLENIIWSIKNLSSTTSLLALGFSFHEVNLCHEEEKCDFVGMEAILSPYLREIGECSVSNFSKRCMASFIIHKNILLRGFAMSCEGFLSLFNWVRKILTLTLNRAASMHLNSDRKISCTDMMRAFDWLRLNLICSFQEIDKMKDHRRLVKPLPNIPDNILQSYILPKQPLDSLLRFKCVSKNWKETISCPKFQSLLREQDDHDQIQSFALFDTCGRTSKMTQKFDGLELVIIEATSPMHYFSSSFHASCSGFLCLDLRHRYYLDFLFTVGNPITGEWTLIPDPVPPLAKQLSGGPGLAVDLFNNPPRYRLVVLVSEGNKNWFYVFSSDTGEWKISNAVLSEIGIDNLSFELDRVENSVYINGLLYWISMGCKLFWFDLDRDEAGSIALPCSTIGFYPPVVGSLQEPVGGQMRLTCTFYSMSNGMMKTYKLVNKNQWIEILSVLTKEDDDVDDSVVLFPYMGGKIQYILRNNSFLAYDVNTGNCRVVLEYDEDGPNNFDCFAFEMNVSPLPKCITR